MKPTDPSPEDDLQSLWQRQSIASTDPSLAHTRRRALAFQARARRRALAGWVSAALAIAMLLWQALAESDSLVRAGELLIAVGVAFAIGLLRHPWPRGLPHESESVQTVIAFYADEVARQNRSRATVVAALVPALIGLCLTLLALWKRDPRPQIAAYAPIVALLILWIAVYIALHRRRARRIARELDDLSPPQR